MAADYWTSAGSIKYFHPFILSFVYCIKASNIIFLNHITILLFIWSALQWGQYFQVTWMLLWGWLLPGAWTCFIYSFVSSLFKAYFIFYDHLKISLPLVKLQSTKEDILAYLLVLYCNHVYSSHIIYIYIRNCFVKHNVLYHILEILLRG